MLISLKPRRRRTAAPRRTAAMEQLEARRLLTAALIHSEMHATCETDDADGDLSVADHAVDDLQSQGPVARIVNGDETTDFESVGIVNGGCTGTLISPTHVLTAAHCVESGRGGFIGDTQGTFTVNGQTYGTVRVTPHPQYNPNDFSAGFDIAIMELDRPVSGVQPSEILRQAPQVGDILTLVGFGESGTSQGGSNFDFGTKHVGQTPLEQVTQNHLFWTLDNHNEANTAPGDSGGPAYVEVNGQLFIAGVTSGGAGDAHGLGGESFDTRVDTLASWIDAVVGDTTPDPDPDPNPDPDPEPNPDPDPVQDDHADAPGADATAIVLDADGTGSAIGVLEEAGDRDVFSVDVAETSSVAIQLDGALDTYLRVYDADGNLIAENDDAGGTLNSALEATLDAGTYYISAGSYFDSEAGDYSVSVQATSIADPDGPDDPDPGTPPFDDVQHVDLNNNNRGRVNGRLRNPGDADVYSFTADSSGRMILTLRGRGSLDTVLTVFDADGNEVAFNDDWRGTDSRVRLNVAAGETYYVQVSGYGDSVGRYRLNLRLRPSAVTANASSYSATDAVFSGNRDWLLFGIR